MLGIRDSRQGFFIHLHWLLYTPTFDCTSVHVQEKSSIQLSSDSVWEYPPPSNSINPEVTAAVLLSQVLSHCLNIALWLENEVVQSLSNTLVDAT